MHPCNIIASETFVTHSWYEAKIDNLLPYCYFHLYFVTMGFHPNLGYSFTNEIELRRLVLPVHKYVIVQPVKCDLN